jgi:NAD(P)-dependent dehydrogenase (short-subunit alcohol dehydrogenase family)
MANELALPEPRILTIPVDLADGPALRSAAQTVQEEMGGAHILIHLVGGWSGGRNLVEIDPQDLDTMLRQHAVSTLNLFQSFVPQLQKSGWGRAIAISSPVASRPVARRAAYAAGKAAQEALFLSLAEELKGTGVTANLIVVSNIDVTGAGNGTTPDEIVAAMLYLCSDEAGKVTGARLPLY